MAEIKIEKKKLLWPWILLGLGGIAVLMYFLTFDDYNGQTNEVPKTSELIGTKETDLINVKENNSTVAAYINFLEISKNRMSLDHAYTNEALSKLIKATTGFMIVKSLKILHTTKISEYKKVLYDLLDK